MEHRMSVDRMAAVVAVSLGVAVLTMGCSKGSSVVSEKAPVLAVEATNAAKPSDAELKLPALSDAKLTAVQFLDALGSEKPEAVERTSIAFRKQITSTLFFGHEKTLGYSDSDALKFLNKQFNNSSSAVIRSEAKSPSGYEVVFRGVLDGKDPMTFSLRVAKDGETWKVTRFASSYNRQSVVPKAPAPAELAWARESALDFLESCLGMDRDYTLAMAIMTDGLMSRLPSPTVHDTGLTYAKKDVRNWLNLVRNGVTGFSIDNEAGNSGVASFNGHLIEQTKNKPFHLSLRHDGNEWKVEQFDVKQ
jgi:hypothetical protein